MRSEHEVGRRSVLKLLVAGGVTVAAVTTGVVPPGPVAAWAGRAAAPDSDGIAALGRAYLRRHPHESHARGSSASCPTCGRRTRSARSSPGSRAPSSPTSTPGGSSTSTAGSWPGPKRARPRPSPWVTDRCSSTPARSPRAPPSPPTSASSVRARPASRWRGRWRRPVTPWSCSRAAASSPTTPPRRSTGAARSASRSIRSDTRAWTGPASATSAARRTTGPATAGRSPSSTSNHGATCRARGGRWRAPRSIRTTRSRRTRAGSGRTTTTCRRGRHAARSKVPILNSETTPHTIVQLTTQPRFGVIYRDDLTRSPAIQLVLWANVTRLGLADDGSAISTVDVKTLSGNVFGGGGHGLRGGDRRARGPAAPAGLERQATGGHRERARPRRPPLHGARERRRWSGGVDDRRSGDRAVHTETAHRRRGRRAARHRPAVGAPPRAGRAATRTTARLRSDARVPVPARRPAGRGALPRHAARDRAARRPGRHHEDGRHRARSCASRNPTRRAGSP